MNDRLDTAIRQVIEKTKIIKSVRCECSGFDLQYEGGCQCRSKSRAEAANNGLRHSLDILTAAYEESTNAS